MRIKKIKNNEYLLSDPGLWIRNPYNNNYEDINQWNLDDYKLFQENEYLNHKLKIPFMENNMFSHKNVIIVSDGYNFTQNHLILSKINATIIAVNGALNKWQLVGESCNYDDRKSINYYIINNPYIESLGFLPKSHRYYPRCLMSLRTYPEFVQKYLGTKLFYQPCPDRCYHGFSFSDFYVDEYRNPVIAALSLAVNFGAERITLFGCDDSFDKARPGCEKLENNLYCYPQQIKSDLIIDGFLSWIKNIKLYNCSYGTPLKHAENIQLEQIVEKINEPL